MHVIRKPSNLVFKTVVIVWLTLSVGSVLLAALTWGRLSEKLAASEDAVAMRDELASTVELLLEAEDSQRGFIITGDEGYLGPFQRAIQQLPARFNRLGELVRSDPLMVNRVMNLRAQVALLVDHHTRVINLRRDVGLGPAIQLISLGEGKQLMDRIRLMVERNRRLRAGFLLGASEDARNQLVRAALTSMIAGAIGVSAGLLAYWLFRLTLLHQQRERELVEEKLQAERTSKEKTVFLANVSHEIRTPMNAILGFSELLAGEVHEPRQQHYVQSIRSSAASLLQLISDILDMSRMEAGMMELRPEPTDPRDVCNFIQMIFSGPATVKGVKLECEIAADVPAAILVDRLRLRQILLNLVGNSVKFTDEGDIRIRVSCQAEPGPNSHVTLVIEVQDTGMGIPQNRLDAIFKPFVQSGANREKEKQGVGLGLSIVKRFADMMGGTVVVDSVLGQGSTFYLRFPGVPVSARLPITDQAMLSGGEVDFDELRPSTILVVDDVEANCQLMAGLLGDSHHRVFFATSGTEALARVREVSPEIILLDLRMPGMDGLETLEGIRRISGCELTPIIASTASSLDSEEGALKQRFNGYLRKPFSRGDLFQELANFIPRAPQGGANSAAVGPGSRDTDEGAGRPPPELLTQLKEILEQEWPALRDGVAVNESRVFAEKLGGLARRWRCSRLLAYAEILSHHAENYAVVELEKELKEFAALVDDLWQHDPA